MSLQEQMRQQASITKSPKDRELLQMGARLLDVDDKALDKQQLIIDRSNDRERVLNESIEELREELRKAEEQVASLVLLQETKQARESIDSPAPPAESGETKHYSKDGSNRCSIGELLFMLSLLDKTSDFRDKVDEIFFNGAWPDGWETETFKRDVAGLLYSAIHDRKTWDKSSVPLVGPPDGYARLGDGTLAKPGMTVYCGNESYLLKSLMKSEGFVEDELGTCEHQPLSRFTASPPAPTAEEALRECLHVLEKGVEPRMMEQWPALTKPLQNAIENARKALEKE